MRKKKVNHLYDVKNLLQPKAIQPDAPQRMSDEQMYAYNMEQKKLDKQRRKQARLDKLTPEEAVAITEKAKAARQSRIKRIKELLPPKPPKQPPTPEQAKALLEKSKAYQKKYQRDRRERIKRAAAGTPKPKPYLVKL